VQETAPPSAELTDDHSGLALSSVSAGILMLLKAHLKGLYGLTEECVSHPLCPACARTYASVPSKCMKFVPGKKSALGDKPAVRKHEHPLTWERLPFATRPVLTAADAEAQKKTVSRLGLTLWLHRSLIARFASSSWRSGTKTVSLRSRRRSRGRTKWGGQLDIFCTCTRASAAF
jgi:hypothetical protein